MSLYSTIQCLQPVHGQQDTFAEQKMHHPHNKNSGFKTVHEYFKDFDEQHRLPYDKRSLRPLVGIRIALGNNTERKVLFYPPLSRHRGFRFPAVQHTPCLFRLQSNASNLSMDLLRHFKTQWIPLRNKETVPGRSFEKVLILKQATSRITVPRFDITGQPFRSHPCHGPIHYSTKLCFNLSLDNRGPFQDNNAVF
ncbi:hypothetical protein TNCT_287371 [Trichonephila clavata]|uniref:Uncharacterized protein n=1 Tax=Trichonephila clavata TaxID=2740835 RepID=A0A8X6H719_TRICU|nr:hypothetical protein TNCT_287371 [Trichonephila clavata]